MLELMQNYIKYAMIPYKLSLCIDYCNICDQWSFINEWNACIADVENLINEAIPNSLELTEGVQTCGGRIRDNIDNHILCANIIEEELLPLICDTIRNIDFEMPINEKYELIRSKSGLFTVRDKHSNKYFHSLNNPMSEAYRLAEYLYRTEAENIMICGAGLGYLAYQLWIKSYKSAHVYILEKDIRNIDLSKCFGVLDWIDKDKLTIICESDDGKLFDAMVALPIDFDNAICWISDFFLDSIEDMDIASSIGNFSENVITRERFRTMERVNIRYNTANTLGDISVLKDKDNSEKREFIVVAAGPSLDDNIQYIKENKNKKKIVVVESALRKILSNGIIPDYVAVLDPTELIKKYITGIEDETSDLVLIAYEKAYWGYIEGFRGDKYIVSKIDSDVDDIHNRVLNCTTVSSLAIEIALYLGGESIELIGLDLAFPENKLYAGQISSNSRICTEAYVRSVDGTAVGTSNVFLQFKNEIEEIIKKSRAKFYNLSKQGAYIQGALMNKWWEKQPVSYVNYLRMLNDDTMLEWNEKYYVLWQAISSYLCTGKNHGADNDCDFWNEVSNIFGKISNAFTTQLKIPAKENICNDKYVVLLTSLYSDESDEISDRIRNDAYNLKHNHGFEVLIVNTNEYLGGKKVALETYNVLSPGEQAFDSGAIFYLGEKLPYFKFEDGMPDMLQTESFLCTIMKKMPISFIAYDTLSLVACACKLVGNVEYR